MSAMKAIAQWFVIAVLASVYLLALFAVLHPRVSPEYKAYYIERTASDWKPVRYASTPQEGITFSRKGVPQWVEFTSGLSFRDDWGRWTDEDLGAVAGLTFARPFSGTLCVDFTARAVPWVVGHPFVVRMGDETQTMRVAAPELTEYRAQFTHLPAADTLDILLPHGLPRVSEAAPKSDDRRRLGLNLATLRIVPGYCPSGEMEGRVPQCGWSTTRPAQ